VILVCSAGNHDSQRIAEQFGIDAATILEQHDAECLVIEMDDNRLNVVATDRAGAAALVLRMLADGMPAADIFPPPPEVQQAVLHGLH
jgi:hypothetical protein